MNFRPNTLMFLAGVKVTSLPLAIAIPIAYSIAYSIIMMAEFNLIESFMTCSINKTMKAVKS